MCNLWVHVCSAFHWMFRGEPGKREKGLEKQTILNWALEQGCFLNLHWLSQYCGTSIAHSTTTSTGALMDFSAIFLLLSSFPHINLGIPLSSLCVWQLCSLHPWLPKAAPGKCYTSKPIYRTDSLFPWRQSPTKVYTHSFWVRGLAPPADIQSQQSQ